MGRKKKPVNNTTIPQYAVERFARCVFDDIRADYAKPEVQAEFQRWLRIILLWYTGRDAFAFLPLRGTGKN